MLPESKSFWIRGDDGEEYGPVGLAELREWVRENRAGLGSEARRDQPDGTWNTWQTYPELVALLAEVNVTSPAPGFAVAPLGRRVLAFILDLVLIGIPVLILCDTMLLIFFPDWVVQYVTSFNQMILDAEAGNQRPFDPADPPLYAGLISEVIRNTFLALYFAGFLAAHGQTPAKALFRLRVVDPFGQKPGPLKAILRTIVLIFSINLLFIPLTYSFFNPQRRALHDFIAGTYVVEA